MGGSKYWGNGGRLRIAIAATIGERRPFKE
jgi:hypothetical protein